MPAGKINEEEESESSAFERKYPPLADPALEHSTPVLLNIIVMIVGVRVKREFKFGRQTAQYTTSLHLHSSMGGSNLIEPMTGGRPVTIVTRN